MRLGYFTMPMHPLDTDYTTTLKQDREAIILCDKLGYYDAFVGEHLSDDAENITNSMLFLGTLFAPVEDRDVAGQGFTHKLGDTVEIASPRLGRLVNTVTHTDKAPEWTFGITQLMRNLAARGLIGTPRT